MGLVTLDVPSPQELRALDQDWAGKRDRDDVAAHWRWYDIALDSPDRFALRAADGSVLCLWASSAARPLMLSEGFAYRLDWLEVAPHARDRGIGAFAMCIIAARAIERGASIVVYGAAPHARTLAFHRMLGAQERTSPPWRTSSDLVPFVLASELVCDLAKRAHERRA